MTQAGLKAARRAILAGVPWQRCQFYLSQNAIVFMLPAKHRKILRTTNGIERAIQQELKRRTRNVRVLPNHDSLLRLASAILVEIDDQWSTSPKRYITRQENMAR